MFILDFFKTWLKDKMSLPIGFFLVLFLLLLVILIPNFSRIESFFGIKSKAELQQEVIQQQETIKQTTEANKELKQNADNQKEIGNAKVDSIVNLNENKQKNETAVKKIIQKKDSVIQGIKNRINKTPNSKIDTSSKEIATTQINAIWEAYCQFNADVTCPKTSL